MICKNEHCRHEIPDDSLFCPDCGTPQTTENGGGGTPQTPVNAGGETPHSQNSGEGTPPKPQPESNIPSGVDSFEKDGAIYHKLKHLHANDNCMGSLFIGDNGEIVCEKCGRRKTINFWRVCQNQEQLALEDLETSNMADITLAGSVVGKAGLEWLNKCTSSIIQLN